MPFSKELNVPRAQHSRNWAALVPVPVRPISYGPTVASVTGLDVPGSWLGCRAPAPATRCLPSGTQAFSCSKWWLLDCSWSQVNLYRLEVGPRRLSGVGAAMPEGLVSVWWGLALSPPWWVAVATAVVIAVVMAAVCVVRVVWRSRLPSVGIWSWRRSSTSLLDNMVYLFVA